MLIIHLKTELSSKTKIQTEGGRALVVRLGRREVDDVQQAGAASR